MAAVALSAAASECDAIVYNLNVQAEVVFNDFPADAPPSSPSWAYLYTDVGAIPLDALLSVSAVVDMPSGLLNTAYYDPTESFAFHFLSWVTVEYLGSVVSSDSVVLAEGY